MPAVPRTTVLKLILQAVHSSSNFNLKQTSVTMLLLVWWMHAWLYFEVSDNNVRALDLDAGSRTQRRADLKVQCGRL